MMLVPLVLVAIVVLVIVLSSQRGPGQRPVSHAQEILDRRLASGQISSEEHARRSVTLVESRSDASRRSPALIVGIVAIVVLLGGAIVWGGTGWGWSEHDGWMGGHKGWSSLDGSADAPVPGAATIEVVATDLRFDPATITMRPGVPVNLTLVNEGRALHDLTIPTLGFMLDADPGEQASGSLTVDEPGTYPFECSVPGHAAAGMRGTLVVGGS